VRPSPWSIGFVMIVLGGASILFASSHGVRPTATGLAVAGMLGVGGFWVMLRWRGAFFGAMAAAGFTAATGVAGFISHREVGLPLPPIVSLVAGLYIALRVLIARPALAPDRALVEPPPDPDAPAEPPPK
jgi:hypothetical protein